MSNDDRDRLLLHLDEQTRYLVSLTTLRA